jgi:hypothetical protein
VKATIYALGTTGEQRTALHALEIQDQAKRHRWEIRGGAEASSSTGGPIASEQRIRYRSDSYPSVNEQVVAEFLHPNSK